MWQNSSLVIGRKAAPGDKVDTRDASMLVPSVVSRCWMSCSCPHLPKNHVSCARRMTSKTSQAKLIPNLKKRLDEVLKIGFWLRLILYYLYAGLLHQLASCQMSCSNFSKFRNLCFASVLRIWTSGMENTTRG